MKWKKCGHTAAWQPRLRALHLLQYLREKGGAAEVVTIEVLAKSKEILDYMVDEVPQCQTIAKALLGKTDSTESTDTDLQQEVPEERSEEEAELKAESGKQASQLRTQDLHSFLPQTLLEYRERRSELQKAPSDRMQQAQEVEDDCPISLDLSSLPVLNWTEELAGNPGECNSVASEAQLEDMNVHKGLPPRTSQQSCQRPYLWLSAVGAVDLEDGHWCSSRKAPAKQAYGLSSSRSCSEDVCSRHMLRLRSIQSQQ
eukprot:symbB.v1.2.040742.t1/scaffold7487.1/size10963/1